jgi:ADP-ribose pyrophosphatase YjhB (NUDIX family)
MIVTLQKMTRTLWRWTPAPIRILLARGTQTKFTASATAIIFNEQGEVLLLDHVFRPTSGWALPGGFFAPREQAADALCREIREETGLELEDVRICHARTDETHIEIFFSARTGGTPEVKSKEIIALRWFKPEDLPENMLQLQRSLIQKVLDGHL